MYLINCSWISDPGCLASTFFSYKKSFYFSRIRFYFASTSSVLAIRRLILLVKVPLKCLNFENPLIVFLICGFKLAPSMNIHRILKFVLQSLYFGFLIKQFFFFKTNFSFEIINTPDLWIDWQILIPQWSKFKLELGEFFGLLLAIDVSFDQIGVRQLNLLIQDWQLMVSFDKLCSEYISFVSYHVVVFLLLGLLLLCGLDYFLHVVYVVFLIFDHLLIWLNLGLGSILLSLDLDVLALYLFIIFIQLN